MNSFGMARTSHYISRLFHMSAVTNEDLDVEAGRLELASHKNLSAGFSRISLVTTKCLTYTVL